MPRFRPRRAGLAYPPRLNCPKRCFGRDVGRRHARIAASAVSPDGNPHGDRQRRGRQVTMIDPTAPDRPRGSISPSGCDCIISIGATPPRRRCCSCMAGATIAATGIGWRDGTAPGLARHCARSARPRRQPMVARRHLHDVGLCLRSGPADPSAGTRPVTIIAHSLGGNIAIRYAGRLSGKRRQLIAIEGLGPSPDGWPSARG